MASAGHGRDPVRLSDADRQLRLAQFRAMNEVMPIVMASAALTTVMLYVVLRQYIHSPDLTVWLVWRLSVNLARGLFSHRVVKGRLQASPANMRTYVLLTFLDGVSWSALGWWLTPVHQLDLALITITMGVIVACMGVLGLHVHVPSALAFLLPVTLPNAWHALGRQDQLGVLGCMAFLGLTLMLIMELLRFNRRFLEVLRLRIESEQTARAKTEALHQAHELAQTRSRFVATMSHEIRTPLHGMLGLLDLARKAGNLPEAERHLALMQSTGDHLVKVINEVLEHARMASSGLPVHAQPFDLPPLLDELADLIRPACDEKGLRFTLDVDRTQVARVTGDATRVRQVLHNLLGNAVKFTAKGGIALEVRRDDMDGRVRITVRDTGVGIPDAEIDRIFEPYHQAEGTYERRFGGTGLGLTISRELCEAMGGSLTCTSEVGVGSVFVCELPLPATDPVPGPDPARGPAFDLAPTSKPKAGEPVQAASHRASPQASCGIHVLLVEDNPVNTIVAEAALSHLGLDVSTVDSGEAALAWLQVHRADVVLMDCEMPGMDGIQTTCLIRAREREAGRPPVPIIAMTANGRDTYEERCVPAGMNDYLSKPFDAAELEAVVMRQWLSQQDRAEALH
ncbi:MAG: ATP-binding protein [Aquabacterium sp.]